MIPKGILIQCVCDLLLGFAFEETLKSGWSKTVGLSTRFTRHHGLCMLIVQLSGGTLTLLDVMSVSSVSMNIIKFLRLTCKCHNDWNSVMIHAKLHTLDDSMSHVSSACTPNLPTKNLPTKICWLKISGKSPMGLGVPPLRIKITP